MCACAAVGASRSLPAASTTARHSSAHGASRACGHTKRPRSSRFANRHSPSPSHHSNFTRSPRRPRNTNSCPENGSSPSCSCTIAASPSKPLRMSVAPQRAGIRRAHQQRDNIDSGNGDLQRRSCSGPDRTAHDELRRAKLDLDRAAHRRRGRARALSRCRLGARPAEEQCRPPLAYRHRDEPGPSSLLRPGRGGSTCARGSVLKPWASDTAETEAPGARQRSTTARLCSSLKKRLPLRVTRSGSTGTLEDSTPMVSTTSKWTQCWRQTAQPGKTAPAGRLDRPGTDFEQ